MKETRGFKAVTVDHMKTFEKQELILMPKRGTKTSSGYDFFAPSNIEILSQESFFFWTDIKVYMLSDEVFNLYPRSSVGIKKTIFLKNTVGIIDSDYYNNVKNDGNIGLFLYNYGDKTVSFEKGDGIVQGIFQKYLVSDNCNSDAIRIGGVGSTNK